MVEYLRAPGAPDGFQRYPSKRLKDGQYNARIMETLP